MRLAHCRTSITWTKSLQPLSLSKFQLHEEERGKKIKQVTLFSSPKHKKDKLRHGDYLPACSVLISLPLDFRQEQYDKSLILYFSGVPELSFSCLVGNTSQCA